jgi:hypothetical protein
MATYMDEREVKMIEDLTEGAVRLKEEDDKRKDLKEKREIMKQTFYGGSLKLKRMIPKGMRL